eukprot:2935676-Pleurochrysis_carterae.AAC.3
MPHMDAAQHILPKPHVLLPPLYYLGRQQPQLPGRCQNLTGTHAGPKSYAEEHIDDCVGPAGTHSYDHRGICGRTAARTRPNGLELPGIGIDVYMAYERSAVYADEARRVMRAYTQSRLT